MRRVRELVSAVQSRYPDDHFFDRFLETCKEVPAKRKVYRSYEDAFRWLDDASWKTLKSKAVAHFQDHRAGQLKQGLFNQLNEALAYRYLIRQGYEQVRVLAE